MKRLWSYVAILSLAAAPVVVVAGDTHEHKTGTTDKAGASTLTGCLGGSEGAYTLKADAKTVTVAGSTALKDHIGHKVKLTGSWMKDDASAGAKTSTTDKATDKAAGDKSGKHFMVSSIEHLAEACTSTSSSTSESGQKKY